MFAAKLAFLKALARSVMLVTGLALGLFCGLILIGVLASLA